MVDKIVVFDVNLNGLSKAAERAAKIIDDHLAPRASIKKAMAEVEVARLEAQRDVEKSRGRFELASFEYRAHARLSEEAARHQENIEKVAALALKSLPDSARPEDVERDWLTFFFERCRGVTNEEMQSMWSKVLSEELIEPGSISRKTIEVVNLLDKNLAHRFTALCSFVCVIDGLPCSLVYEPAPPTLQIVGLGYADALELADAGLIRMQLVDGTTFTSKGPPDYKLKVTYFGREFVLTPKGSFNHGRITLTQAGVELYSIAGAQPHQGCFEKMLACWEGAGYMPIEAGGRTA
jgi:hypothetical protein